MFSQISKAALAALARAEFVVMSMRTQLVPVADRLEQVYLEALPPGTEGGPPLMPDWELVQESNATLLEFSGNKVRQADQLHRLNKVELGRLRNHRQELFLELKAQHRDLRQSVRGTYGRDSLALVGLDAPPARAQVAAREQALEVLERMSDSELLSKLPEPLSGQKALDFEFITNAISDRIRGLEETMKEIRRVRKLEDESLAAKRRVLKQHRRIFLNLSRVQEAYTRLAGFDHLADRIRATEPRRRSASAEKEETAPEEGSEPAQEGSEQPPEGLGELASEPGSPSFVPESQPASNGDGDPAAAISSATPEDPASTASDTVS